MSERDPFDDDSILSSPPYATTEEAPDSTPPPIDRYYLEVPSKSGNSYLLGFQTRPEAIAEAHRLFSDSGQSSSLRLLILLGNVCLGEDGAVTFNEI